jgi:hypothetical protein
MIHSPRNLLARAFRASGVLALWLVCGWYCSPAQPAESGAVLIKDSDRVILGKIERRGEFYEIEIASQSRVKLPVSQIAFIGRSLEEIYQFKVQSVVQWNTGDHFQLTTWCMVNGLLEQAVEHYSQVAKHSPDHPRVKQLAVELERRLLQDPLFRQYLGLAPHPTAVSGASPTGASNRAPGADESSSVVSAGGLQNSDMAMHPEIAHYFSNRVQPILMNRCSQSACHGVQSSNSLRLLEPYAKAYAQVTAANLTSVLAQISTNPTELSPLVQYATRAHGIQRTAAIAVTETNLVRELQEWIEFARNPVSAASGQNALQATEAAVISAGTQTTFVPFQSSVTFIPVPAGNALSAQPAPPPFDEPTIPNRDGAPPPPFAPASPAPPGFPVGSSPPTDAEIDALAAQIERALRLQSSGSTSGLPVAEDPFDPDEFNRSVEP